MGYVMIHGPCGACGGLFSFNPRWVPSLNNVAFCGPCMAAANAKREAMGITPHPIHHEAYEPLPEHELLS